MTEQEATDLLLEVAVAFIQDERSTSRSCGVLGHIAGKVMMSRFGPEVADRFLEASMEAVSNDDS